MTDEEYMILAINEAEKAFDKGEIPIGAVVTYKGAIIATAHNKREHTTDPTSHAEIVALRKAAQMLERWRLTGCTLYVTIEPCPMCAGAILNARIDRIVYGASDRKYGAIKSVFHLCDTDVLNHHVEVKDGVLSERCKQLMDSFFSLCR